MTSNITPDEAKELRLLWSVYHTATARVLAIMKTIDTTDKGLPMILAAHREASGAMKRIMEIRGEK